MFIIVIKDENKEKPNIYYDSFVAVCSYLLSKS